MKCVNQRLVNGVKVSCGKCPACFANETNSLIIRFRASAKHCAKYFLTLTYRDDSLPFSGVYQPDVEVFFDNLRECIGKSFKHVSVAEYGGRFCRPHYHINLFSDEKILNVRTIIEDCWSLGRVDVKDLNNVTNDLKRLNYVAKYHSTIILSQNIYRLADYPLFFRQDDDETIYSAKQRLAHRLGVGEVDLWQYNIVPCAPPFRMVSKFIGAELLDSPEFLQSVKSGKFFVENNNGKLCALPSYYVDKLSIDDRVRRNLANLDYAVNRKENAIDVLSYQLNDVDLANEIMYKKWLENYNKSVLERKRHKQKEL